MNGTELLHFSWSLCIGAEVAVQTAAGAGPATRVVHRAAVFPSQAEKTDYMSDPGSDRRCLASTSCVCGTHIPTWSGVARKRHRGGTERTEAERFTCRDALRSKTLADLRSPRSSTLPSKGSYVDRFFGLYFRVWNGGNNETDSSSAPENRHLRRKGKP
ncbi:hypothetical protein ACH5RR_008564 [Cinchona calisaya]|uniref:Secreted protein n=1 Tax=Cinchona calisaya TaxID=153742 RepID=A0ABD3ABZ8_9GENT